MDDLEARLSQKLSRLAQKPLFQVFLGVHKAYNSLDMGRCLEIPEGYRLGPNLAYLLGHYWER